VTHLNYPAAGFVYGNGFLLLDFFALWFDLMDITIGEERPLGTTSARFLDENREETLRAGIELSYEFVQNLFFRTGYTYEKNRSEGVNIFNLSLALNGVE